VTRYSGSTIISGGGGGPNPTDSFSLKIVAADSSAAPTDAAAFTLQLTEPESNAAPADTVTVKPTWADTTAAPTDAQSFVLRIWLSGSTNTSQVTNPANADGQNNATVATLQTAPAGATSSTMTSTLGANVGTVAFTSAVYRGWFKSVTTLPTSTVTIVLHSTSALFTDVTAYTFSATNGTDDHLSGNFTFDVIAAGINTLAKLQSVQVLHHTTDAAAGVTPAVLTVDAGALDVSGVFA
jgi:hypothetical protein